MVNQEIAQILYNMSSYLEMETGQGAFFRSRALRKAAETLERFPYDLAQPEWYENTERLKSIEGIGPSTAKHIQDYVKTGYIPEYEVMKKESPVKLEELLQVQGVGPKTILKLYKKLGVTDIDTLKTAAETDQIAQLEGFGKKSQEKILKSIDFAIKNKDRKLLIEVEEEIKELTKYLSRDPDMIMFEPVGSFRRKKETIGDIDILACSKNPNSSMQYFTKYQKVESILGSGETKSSVWLKTKIQADIRIIDEQSFGAGLQYFTGSKEHNVRLRNLAIEKGYKLSEYGLFSRKDNTLIEGKNEEKIYELLGLDFIVPEIREDKNEIEAAKNHTLPHLISIKDVKGDLQMHSTWSDGKNTIDEMAQKAVDLGYKYIGITDHFGKLKVANAIDESEFEGYMDAIKKAREKFPNLKILASGEIEIDKEGNLEFNEMMLKKLDYVLASVHFSTNMDYDSMTKRLIKALKNPLTTILGHPTGRILNKRPGYEFDYKTVFAVAKENNVALEIDAHPMRIDLNSDLVRLAKGIGAKIVIDTDAHSTNELEYMKYGVYNARRGWIEPSDLFEFL